jgi:hypothetical protein
MKLEIKGQSAEKYFIWRVAKCSMAVSECWYVFNYHITVMFHVCEQMLVHIYNIAFMYSLCQRIVRTMS